MDFSIRTATPAEQMYSYSQSGQIEAQTGCIGHLRADFGSDGNSFYSSWADHNASLKDQAFKDEYINLKEPLVLRSYTAQNDDMTTVISAEVEYKGKTSLVSGTGNGPLDALCVALRKLLGKDFEICAYTEHALERKSSSKAATYIAIKDNDDNESVFWGVGVHENISTASVYALISAVNRELSK